MDKTARPERNQQGGSKKITHKKNQENTELNDDAGDDDPGDEGDDGDDGDGDDDDDDDDDADDEDEDEWWWRWWWVKAADVGQMPYIRGLMSFLVPGDGSLQGWHMSDSQNHKRHLFKHRSFYTEIVHREAFTAFTQRSLYAQQLLHTEAFTHRSLYTGKPFLK